jgi:hypothetical protein
MKKAKNSVGNKFGRLIIKSLFSRKNKKNGHNIMFAECNCLCGNNVEVTLNNLNTGHTTSCGCVRLEKVRTHNRSKTKEYHSWSDIRARCNNKNHKRFIDYGGRGITVSKNWDSFEIFYKEMGHAPDGKTLDRIDNNGNYCKENCRWATTFEQANNRRNTVIIKIGETTDTIRGWSNRLGISYNVLYGRYRRNNKII